MSKSKPGPPNTHLPPAAAGAVFRPYHVERQVRIYPIQENELRTIGTLNGMIAFWCSIGTSALTLILTCLWTVCTSEQPLSSTARAFVWACVAVVLGSYGFAFLLRRSRNGQLQKILEETRQPT